MHRSFRLARFLVASGFALVVGCGGSSGKPDIVWGHRGLQFGDFIRPRAIAIDSKDRLFIVDFTARIQVFDRDGNYLGKTWTTPDYRNGRPSGLSIDRQGHLLVSDSHYHTIRVYTPEGKQLRTFGGEGGSAPGQLAYVSDVVQDEAGYYYVAEFGENERISKFDSEFRFVRCWGKSGTEPGSFSRARALALGPDGLLYVADACNHRIQVFDIKGKLVRHFGQPGKAPGQLGFPYDLAFDGGGTLYVAERGNHRVQRFRTDGTSLGCWCGPGRGPGQLHNPWGLAVDSEGAVHVLDTENHRVQRFSFGS